MISVKEAEKRILSHSLITRFTHLNIDNLSGEVLQQSLVADRDYPPHNRVAMDGIAISYDSWKKGCLSFDVEECQRAGEPRKRLSGDSKCIEVMTGATLPQGADAVIKYEDLQISNGKAILDKNLVVTKMQNVHQKGSDCKKGAILEKAGAILDSPHWSIAAAIGCSELQVSGRPNISIVSTGDELVDINETPANYQIRKSNSYALMSSLRAYGFNSIDHFHLHDDENEIVSSLKEILETSEVIIISGGVSRGKYDFIPDALIKLRVKEIFHKVRQRPGKPLWFGIAERNKMIFGLPGNPISSLICLHRYVLPALWKSLGIDLEVLSNRPYAILAEDFRVDKKLTCFLPVKVAYHDNGTITARAISFNGSGDFTSLAKSSGFVELGEDRDFFQKGEAFPLYLWRG